MKTDQAKISLLGHKDHGKSTLIGKLLYETQSLREERIKEAKASSEGEGEDFEYAFLLDSFQEEREGKFTLDTTRAQVEYKNHIYELIDVPGHKKLIKNMVTGASVADAAILIVAADKGLEEETESHLYLANMLGIENLVIAINKMDLQNYEEEKFEEVKEEIEGLLDRFGYKEMSFVPISAKKGDNVVENSERMEWYNGKTILEFLQDFAEFDYQEKLEKLPARMSIQDIYDINGKAAVGKLETGKLRKGEDVVIKPSNTSGKIKELMVKHREEEEANAGQNISIKLNTKMNGVGRGDICMAKNSAAEPRQEIEAKVFCLPGQEIELNEKLDLTSACQECEVEIINIEDKSSFKGEVSEEQKVGSIETAKVKIKLDRPLVLESFSKIQPMGRFILTDDRVRCVGTVI